MNSRILSFAFALAALALPAVAQEQQSQAEIRQRIEHLATAWQDAYNKKDVQALGNLLAQDATFTSADWSGNGRQAIERHLQEEIRGGMMKNLHIRTEQVQPLGPHAAWATGTWTAELSPQMASEGGVSGGGSSREMSGSSSSMSQPSQGVDAAQRSLGQSQGGRQAAGHWLAIDERQGNEWKIRAVAINTATQGGGMPVTGTGTAPQGGVSPETGGPSPSGSQ